MATIHLQGGPDVLKTYRPDIGKVPRTVYWDIMNKFSLFFSKHFFSFYMGYHSTINSHRNGTNDPLSAPHIHVLLPLLDCKPKTFVDKNSFFLVDMEKVMASFASTFVGAEKKIAGNISVYPMYFYPPNGSYFSSESLEYEMEWPDDFDPFHFHSKMSNRYPSEPQSLKDLKTAMTYIKNHRLVRLVRVGKNKRDKLERVMGQMSHYRVTHYRNKNFSQKLSVEQLFEIYKMCKCYVPINRRRGLFMSTKAKGLTAKLGEDFSPFTLYQKLVKKMERMVEKDLLKINKADLSFFDPALVAWVNDNVVNGMGDVYSHDDKGKVANIFDENYFNFCGELICWNPKIAFACYKRVLALVRPKKRGSSFGHGRIKKNTT